MKRRCALWHTSFVFLHGLIFPLMLIDRFQQGFVLQPPLVVAEMEPIKGVGGFMMCICSFLDEDVISRHCHTVWKRTR